MKQNFTQLLVTVVLCFSVNLAFSQHSPTGDIWLHMLSTGTPMETRVLGDRLNQGSTYYINFEIGQGSWFQSDAGIGISNSDPSEWTWRSASWYEDGAGSNKMVHADFGDFQFTQSGGWYFCGRAKAEAGDPWHYANSDGWGNVAEFQPINYFLVNEIDEASMVSAYRNIDHPTDRIDLTWTRNSKLHNVLVLRKKSTESWGAEPVQGTAYTAGATIGNATVVYNSSDTVFTDSGLTASTLYNYKFYSANNNYYSPVGVETQACTTFENGDGTAGNPYQVSTADGLNVVRYFLMVGIGEANFIQTADIDLTAYSTGNGWVPIDYIRDSYDGQGHTISNLTINNPSVGSAGLFASVSTGTVKNLGLLNVDIKSGSSAGALTAQVSVGEASTGIQIENCYSTGSVEIIAGGTGAYYVGGLVGNQNAGMKECYSTCDVTVSYSASHQYVGGLVGFFSGDTLRNSYYHGTIDCNTSDYYQEIGGVAGGATGFLKNCYSAASISYFPTQYYDWIGGVSGRFSYNGNCGGSFYDSDLSGINIMGQGIDLTTVEMKSVSPFIEAGWDFTSAGEWAINSSVNDGYPFLRNQNASSDFVWLGSTSTEWSTASNWSENAVPGNDKKVIIPQVTNDPIIDAAAEITNLSIEAGGALTISGTGQLTVSGTLVNLADSSSLIVGSSGSLINGTSGVKATVKRNIPANEWHLIAAPISNATASVFEGYYLQKHSETSNSYSDITSLFESLVPGQGYAHYGDAAFSSASFAGQLNVGPQSYTTTYSGSGKGWNLVGNPYPSSIDWDAPSGFTKSNLNNAVYIHKDADTWATYIDGVGTNSGSRYIAPCQGFFVEATAAGELGMNNSVRVHNSTPFFKNAGTVSNMIRLEVSGNGYLDETVVRFLPEATTGFDGNYDAHKILGDNAQAAQIYSLGNSMLSINSLPEVQTITLGVIAGSSGNYTIAATEINDLPFVALEDLKTGIYTELAKSSYSFQYTEGESGERFKLHFSATGAPEGQIREANIYSYGNTIYVNLNGQKDADIFIYSVSGQIMEQKLSASGMNQLEIGIPGTYMVRVVNKETCETRKVVIH
ncbi:MAG: T9SS type A sorting domain-containing protein [Bacteroidales bacterium]|nr:T9SS type A sorting domain-containing protein [Bacteroidales bacterium]